jgi:hypothetical protein
MLYNLCTIFEASTNNIIINVDPIKDNFIYITNNMISFFELALNQLGLKN